MPIIPAESSHEVRHAESIESAAPSTASLEAAAMEAWFDALRWLKPHVPQDELKHLVMEADLRVGSDWLNGAFSFQHGGNNAVGFKLGIQIQPAILIDWYRAEQREAFLFAGVIGFLFVRQGLSWGKDSNATDSQRSLCALAGCACTNSDSPSERWRKLLVQGGTFEPLGADKAFDEIPECKICHRLINSDEPYTNAHVLCRAYARTVIIPELRANRRAEKLVRAAEADK